MSNFDSSNKEIDNSKLDQANLDFTRSQSYPSTNSSASTLGSSLGRSNSNYGLNSYENSGYSPYNSYSSGYGGYSGYGSTYGNGYGNYGGYRSGYSSYGSNQYSNTYSKPIPQNQGNEQIPPPTFKHDVWGFLNGFHAILNVLYAGTGIVHFGKMFFKMSIKIIKMVFGKSAGVFFKLTGFRFLKDIMQSFSKDASWQTEFSFQETPLENAWGPKPEGEITKTFFGKFMLVLRICSLMGALISFFLRKRVKTQNQNTPMQVEIVTPEIQHNFEPKVLKLEDITNMYEEIRLIDNNLRTKREQISLSENLTATDEQTEIETKIVNNIDEELENESSSHQSLSLEDDLGSKEDEKLKETIDISNKLIEENEFAKGITEEAKENTEEETKLPIVQEEIVHFQEKPEDIKINQSNLPKNLIPTHDNLQDNNTNTKEQVLSEDFWQNRNEFKIPQETNPEKTEEPKKTFVVPSVLQTLKAKSSTSNKPWLMKKKTTPEIKIEENQEQKNIESSVSLDKNFEVFKETSENAEEICFENTKDNAL